MRELFRQAPGFVAILRGQEHVFEFANDAYLRLIGGREVLGRSVREAIPEIADQGFFDLLDRVYRTGEPYTAFETPVLLRQSGKGELEQSISLLARDADYSLEMQSSGFWHVALRLCTVKEHGPRQSGFA